MKISAIRLNSIPRVPFFKKIENKTLNTGHINRFSNNLRYCSDSVIFGSNEKTKTKELMSELKRNSCKCEKLLEIQKASPEVQSEFIKEYCKETGFPNLDAVNNNMKNHATKIITEAAKSAELPLLWCGFHKQCSASYNLALPGSDLDATSVIVDGEQNQIDKFKSNLWNLYNPMLVSIRKELEFPDVYSVDQLYEWCRLIDRIMIEEGYYNKKETYLNNLKESSDFEKALEFNIDIAKTISNYNKDFLKQLTPSVSPLIEKGETPKNITQAMSSCLETLRSGNTLFKIEEDKLPYNTKIKLERIKNSYIYKYGNLCMQEAGFPAKEILIKRKEIINNKNFKKMKADDKLNLILKMIYMSYPDYLKADLKNSKSACEFTDFLPEIFYNGTGIDESRNYAFSQTVDN